MGVCALDHALSDLLTLETIEKRRKSLALVADYLPTCPCCCRYKDRYVANPSIRLLPII